MEFNDGTGYFYGEESIPEIWEEIPIVEEDIFQGYTEEEEPISIKKAVRKEGQQESRTASNEHMRTKVCLKAQ